MTYWLNYDALPCIYRFLAGFALALGLGWALVRHRPRRDRFDAALLFLAPAATYLLLTKAILVILDLRQVDWASGRITPAISLLHGFTLYYPRDSGPIYNTIYAPMSYLVYLPAALFQGPTWTLIAGAAISQIFSLAPILAICFSPHGEKARTRSPLFSTFIFLGFWKFTFHPVLNTLTAVHADSPAIGFACLACAVLYARRMEITPSNRTLLSSAVFASLAVWSKQTAAPLLLALPLWIFLTHGLRSFARFAGWMAASLAATTGLLVSAFGFRELMFNLIEIPKGHPWMFHLSYTKGFLVIAMEDLFNCLPLAYLALLCLFLIGRRLKVKAVEPVPVDRLSELRGWFRANPWVMFTLAGVALVPLSFLGRIKFGGGLNSYAPTLYLLLASVCVLILDWHGRNLERGRLALDRVLKVAVLVCPLSPLLLLDQELFGQFNMVTSIGENAQEQAYQYAMRHPGEAYFPWNPLSSLLAEGQAYHFEFGIFDRDLGNCGPEPSHIRKHLPGKMKLIAYPPNRMLEYSMKNFPEFSKRVWVAELPGWICYER